MKATAPKSTKPATPETLQIPFFTPPELAALAKRAAQNGQDVTALVRAAVLEQDPHCPREALEFSCSESIALLELLGHYAGHQPQTLPRDTAAFQAGLLAMTSRIQNALSDACRNASAVMAFKKPQH